MKAWVVAGISFFVIGLVLVVLFVNILWGDSPGNETGTREVTASVNADPAQINPGGSATLSWSSTNATVCSGVNFPTEGKESGSVQVAPSEVTQYDLICSNDTDVVVESITVAFAQGVPTVSVSSSASLVAPGQPVTLTWSSGNADQCSSAEFSAQGAVSGSIVVAPTGTTTYTVDCIQVPLFATSHDSVLVTSGSVTVQVSS